MVEKNMSKKKEEGEVPAKQWIFERKQTQSFRIEMCKGKVWMECKVYSEDPITRDNAIHGAATILRHCLSNSELLDRVVFLDEDVKGKSNE